MLLYFLLCDVDGGGEGNLLKSFCVRVCLLSIPEKGNLANTKKKIIDPTRFSCIR